ncbi:MAG: serine hydrolase [Pseudoxanthomonas sp.]|nr:serine hydrolase [Pseudoxanthomonas sp.]
MKTRSAALVATLAAALAGVLAIAGPAQAMTDAGLADVVRQRLHGDRTGACMAVAVIEKDHVARTFQCARDGDVGRIGADTAFEIGSVSKTMTGALLAELIAQGKGSLDDTLASWLPEGTKVPDWQGQPILLRHVVTHTSGLPALPSRMEATATDPYAKLDEAVLLASLAEVKLRAAPGAKFEYSNFAMMLLSQAIARRAGTDFESLARRELFAPLGMSHAYINQPPTGVRVASGHASSGQVVPAWHFATDLAGVGGVRATLDDMVRYVQGGMGWIDVPVARALRKTHEPLTEQMGMNWMRTPIKGRTVLWHEGATGGFSSFVSLDPQRQRGVVILSDTSWTAIGGLGSLGMHLVDESLPLGGPRKAVAAEPALLQALVGEYRLQETMTMTLRQRDGRLFIQADGQGEFEMGHDDAGDFFPLAFDAVLRPQRRVDGSYGFTWMQSGAAIPATRVDHATSKAQSPSAAELAAYAGDYPLMPSFSLNVREQGGRLYAQATGQGAFPLDATAVDTFEAPAFGIEIVFRRDAAGKVESLELHQAGHVMRGVRQ